MGTYDIDWPGSHVTSCSGIIQLSVTPDPLTEYYVQCQDG